MLRQPASAQPASTLVARFPLSHADPSTPSASGYANLGSAPRNSCTIRVQPAGNAAADCRIIPEFSGGSCDQRAQSHSFSTAARHRCPDRLAVRRSASPRGSQLATWVRNGQDPPITLRQTHRFFACSSRPSAAREVLRKIGVPVLRRRTTTLCRAPFRRARERVNPNSATGSPRTEKPC